MNCSAEADLMEGISKMIDYEEDIPLPMDGWTNV